MVKLTFDVTPAEAHRILNLVDGVPTASRPAPHDPDAKQSAKAKPKGKPGRPPKSSAPAKTAEPSSSESATKPVAEAASQTAPSSGEVDDAAVLTKLQELQKATNLETALSTMRKYAMRRSDLKPEQRVELAAEIDGILAQATVQK